MWSVVFYILSAVEKRFDFILAVYIHIGAPQKIRKIKHLRKWNHLFIVSAEKESWLLGLFFVYLFFFILLFVVAFCCSVCFILFCFQLLV